MRQTLARLYEQLASVEQAIARIEDGAQSATLGDMTYTEASIHTLYMREQRLLNKIARLDGTRPFASNIKL
jgi:hypothetical protein